MPVILTGIAWHEIGRMMMRNNYLFSAALLLAVATSGDTFAAPPDHAKGNPPPHAAGGAGQPIVLSKMGAFAFSGTTISNPAGQTLHCDHGYAQFQIPKNPRKVPIVFWHSASTVTWESSPDGRDGFQSIFLRKGFATYIIDLPRQGRAGNGCEELLYTPRIGQDQSTYEGWRFGTWSPPAPPDFFPGVQVPTNDPAWLDGVLRARYPESSGPDAVDRESNTVAALLDKIGGGIIVTHSGSGIPGWATGVKSPDVKAIVSYEPSQFLFPTGQLPTPITNPVNGQVIPPGLEIPLSDFMNLTKMPIQLVYGDYVNIPHLAAPERRRITMIYGQQMVDLINSLGGDAELVHLPEIGIHGNTHLLMLDLNNVEIANLMSQFLSEKGLDAQ
jgi:hypothetical protein